jgi:integrase
MNNQTFAVIKHFCTKTLQKTEWVKHSQLIPEVEKLVNAYLARSKTANPTRPVRDYLKTLQRYTDFVDKTPTQLIDEIENDERLPKRQQRNPAALEIADFIRHLQAEGELAHNSIVLAVSHVRTFYRANGFEIHGAMPISARITKEAKPMDKALALEALQSAESHKVKALVHLLWSTGLSIGDACKAKRTDIEHIGNWGVLTLHRGKTGSLLMTVLTPDCLETLDRWFSQSKEEERILGYYVDSAQQALRRLAREIGLGGNGERNPLHPHNFRHGFSNALKNAPLDSELVEWMMGHNIGTAAYYNEMTSQQLVERVKPFYGALELTGAANSHVADLEKEVAGLRSEVGELKQYLEWWQQGVGDLVKDKQKLRKELSQTPKKKKKVVRKD